MLRQRRAHALDGTLSWKPLFDSSRRWGVCTDGYREFFYRPCRRLSWAFHIGEELLGKDVRDEAGKPVVLISGAARRERTQLGVHPDLNWRGVRGIWFFYLLPLFVNKMPRRLGSAGRLGLRSERKLAMITPTITCYFRADIDSECLPLWDVSFLTRRTTRTWSGSSADNLLVLGLSVIQWPVHKQRSGTATTERAIAVLPPMFIFCVILLLSFFAISDRPLILSSCFSAISGRRSIWLNWRRTETSRWSRRGYVRRRH